jgi:predicted LPLAT superfamily acyltransferase
VDGRYQIHLDPFLDNAHWQRGQRNTAIQHWVQRYADHLAQQCLVAPQQWFNFYAYWQPAKSETTDAN